MKYKFEHLNKDDWYNNVRVMIICGEYGIFNNIVVDRLRDKCKGAFDDDDLDISDLLEEFDAVSSSDRRKTIQFKEFIQLSTVPPVDGKWFCSVDYSELSKKDISTLENYNRKPSEHGLLVVVIREFKDYRKYLSSNLISNSQYVHLIQLAFPRRDVLKEVIELELNKRDTSMGDRSKELFIMKMSRNYNDYSEVLDNLAIGMSGKIIEHEELVARMKGIDFFVIDDLLYELLSPVKNSRIYTRRRIYKMVGNLKSDLGARGIVMRLKGKIDDMLEMRIAINGGIVPVTVRFSAPEAKNRLPENSKIKKLSDYSFKRCAYIASQTSLADWMFMKLMLNNVTNKWEDASYERVLIALVHRQAIPNNRLMNDVGISDVIEEELYDLNSLYFGEYYEAIASDLDSVDKIFESRVDKEMERKLKKSSKVKEEEYEEIILKDASESDNDSDGDLPEGYSEMSELEQLQALVKTMEERESVW